MFVQTVLYCVVLFLQNGVRHTTYRRLFSTAPVLAGKQVLNNFFRVAQSV